MVYAFDLRAAPRIVLLPVVASLLIGGAIVLLVLVHVAIGLIALAIAGWLTYHLLRFTITHVKSQVRTSDEGIVSLSSFGVETRIPWSNVTHAGTFDTRKSDRYLFVYNESTDELVTVPSYYTEITELENELKTNARQFLQLTGNGPDDLAGVLRPYLEE